MELDKLPYKQLLKIQEKQEAEHPVLAERPWPQIPNVEEGKTMFLNHQRIQEEILKRIRASSDWNNIK